MRRPRTGEMVIAISAFVACLGLIRSRPFSVVMSQSMSPALKAGDAILIRPVDRGISPGEIVTFDMGGRLITHRVAGIRDGLLVTKGDNNHEVDPWTISPDAVIGAPVVRVPYLGFVLQRLRGPLGWFVFILLPAAWVIFSSIRRFETTIRPQRSEERAPELRRMTGWNVLQE